MKITLSALITILCSKKRKEDNGEVCIVYLGNENFLLHSGESNQEFGGSLIYDGNESEAIGATVDWKDHINKCAIKAITVDATLEVASPGGA